MNTDDIHGLRRDIRLLKAYALSTSVIIALLLLSAFRPHAAPDVIHARGLVIEDANGRERILIGAPVPAAKNRVRTDLERVKAIWGPRFPKEYMEYYAKYRNDVNGLVVLDENGFDRLAIGDSVPDPNIGRRIAPSTGIVINDAQGFERTGWGILHFANGNYRVDLGLDKKTDAVSLIVDDATDLTGVHVSDGKRSLFLGLSAARSPFTGLSTPLHGLIARDSLGTRQAVFTPPARP